MTAAICTHDIEAARCGDRAALERVLAHSRQDLRRYAEYHCVVNDAEDAVQEALLQAARRIGDLRAAERFTSWLFRIVKRECNRLKRGLRLLTGLPVTEDLLTMSVPPVQELRHEVALALDALPAHYRRILLLRDLEGLSVAEMADRLQLTREAVKARLHRARALAREYLAP